MVGSEGCGIRSEENGEREVQGRGVHHELGGGPLEGGKKRLPGPGFTGLECHTEFRLVVAILKDFLLPLALCGLTL